MYRKIFGLICLVAICCVGINGFSIESKEVGEECATGKGLDDFYVYSDKDSPTNHFIPSGWMGDINDIKFNDQAIEEFAAGATSIKITYTAKKSRNQGWAGIYWQHPPNNWGDKRGGYDLSKYSKLSFWVKGNVGGEVIDKIFFGGITGQTEEGDSDEASISPVEVTKEWQKFEIDLEGLDMSHVIGGFGLAANADANPDGFIIFIDEIMYEK